MPQTPHEVLVATIEAYEAEHKPVCERTVARSLGATPVEVRKTLDRLHRVEFLVATDAGYRPTVTAREFLELDITLNDVTAVDLVDG
ncbi:hypothetical protein [Halomicrobium sp. LC1Hm]|uniref:hypothetical protein n=1 Tax=Halomicrobium sp. LC1Hm TaxID=2610902 RepID=UPI00129856EA|nr:hypothetical protein [Halomicrobium sp. LC1Hm]QGA84084.1 Transcriptional regulator, MarR family [Halomicrobium sp. LC1Hm]